MYIQLSPLYTIRNQKNCSYLIRRDNVISQVKYGFSVVPIPPFIGYILSRIGRYKLDVSIKKLSQETGLSIYAITNFVNQLIGIKECKEFKFSSNISIVLPPDLLQEGDQPVKDYFETEDFQWYQDFEISRPTMPISVNLMVTTKCNTSCSYCYADRTLTDLLSVEEIITIIKEMKTQGVVNLTLTGGDVFALPGWEKVMTEVHGAGYKPFLSTKTPLSRVQIQHLIGLGYREIQFSLDSNFPTILTQLIKVDKGYINRVARMFRDCSNLGMNILIRSVLTNLNGNASNLHSFNDFLSEYPCIKEWVMTPAFFSEYQQREYKEMEIGNEDLKYVYNFAHTTQSSMKIGLSKIGNDGYKLKRCSCVDDFVTKNQICLANTTCISILANGKCSLCEMLYGHSEYILGDIRKESLKSIWNSPKALQLYKPKQHDVSPDSPCRECSVFDKCKTTFGKRVCYLDITKSGGSPSDPDPRCPLSLNHQDVIL